MSDIYFVSMKKHTFLNFGIVIMDLAVASHRNHCSSDDLVLSSSVFVDNP
jgi:hypothetical protein